ncbi:hypothetical protein D0Y65_049053 [Glycine soja]|uniref:Retrotransposon gag domain-containing protein n=1 Tax=Glycine soja TaxID=3848 RepID=A0A445FV89_GLYSO|nr:hypothetical protein D0Y65_049053 [Glycine soja]
MTLHSYKYQSQVLQVPPPFLLTKALLKADVKTYPAISRQLSLAHPWLALGLTSDTRPLSKTSSSSSYDRHKYSKQLQTHIVEIKRCHEKELRKLKADHDQLEVHARRPQGDKHSAHTFLEHTQGESHSQRIDITDDLSLSHMHLQARRTTRQHLFVDWIMEADIPLAWKPLNLERYDGTTYSNEHLDAFLTQANLYTNNDAILCHVFPLSFKEETLTWYGGLPPKSIDNFDTLVEQFSVNFQLGRTHQATPDEASQAGVRRNQILQTTTKQKQDLEDTKRSSIGTTKQTEEERNTEVDKDTSNNGMSDNSQKNRNPPYRDFKGINPVNQDNLVVVSIIIPNFMVSRVFIDQGSSTDILYWKTFQRLEISPNIFHPHVGPFLGFTSEMVETRGYVDLMTTFGQGKHSRIFTIRYLLVDVYTSYFALICRKTRNKLGAIVSTPHLKMKFPTLTVEIVTVKANQKQARQCYVENLNIAPCSPIKEPAMPHPIVFEGTRVMSVDESRDLTSYKQRCIANVLYKNVGLFAWQPADMPGIHPSIIYHKIVICPQAKPISQKKWKMREEQLKAVKEEVDKLLNANFIKEVRYSTWLTNVVMVYVDDMVVKSQSIAQHVAEPEEVFGELRKYDMRLNPEKHVLRKLELAGRIVAWSVEISEFDIHYEPCGPMKTQFMADFLAEFTENDKTTPDRRTLYVGSGTRIILEGPDNITLEQALKLNFRASNN